MTTYKEMLDLVLDYFGATVSTDTIRFARQAVQHALRQLQQQRRWAYYMGRLRINANGAQTDGTVEYDHTGGTYERMLTLTDSTWPTWATYGSILIGNVTYEVAEWKTTTVITLTEASNPGEDIASGTSYTLLRDTYPLPADFNQLDDPVKVDGCYEPMVMVHPNEWLMSRQANSIGTPGCYCLRGDPNYQGVLAISISPPADSDYSIDATYNRKPRPLKIEEYCEGTVTTTSGSTTVTGTGTVWTSLMIGSIIRFSDASLFTPTGLMGANPYYIERVIMDVASSTSLTIDANLGVDVTVVKYSISDPVDVEDSMLDLLRAECFKQARMSHRISAMPEEAAEYERCKERAHEADAKSAAFRYEGECYWPWPRDVATSSEVV